MEEKKLVPKLRFPGFTEPWEQRKLEGLCDLFTDGDWIESKDQCDSGVRLIQTGNIGVTEYLDKPDNKKWISDETFNQLHCKEVFPGDILISRLPEPAGRACIIPHLGTKMITAVDCTIVRTLKNTNASFLVQYLSSQPYFNEVNKCLAGGTRQRISRSALAEFKVLVPSEKAEQDIIGKVFDKFDSLITLHQRKLEHLKLKKKSLLQKLFPKEGEVYPELRFPGFTDPWEQRKFSELFEYERPDAYIVQSDLYCDEYNVPVLTANKAFILGYTNEECTYNKPSIIFDDFTLDRKYVDFPYMLKSSAIKILTAKENHNLRFLFERLNSTRFEVLGHARHYISVVQNTSTLCPTLDEENCISTILTKVDTLLTLHQRKLEHLQLLKKALLQQLFV